MVNETSRVGWYSEEPFARFSVVQATGEILRATVGNRPMTRARPRLWWLPVVGAATTILLQILWPLTSGQQRTELTIITVMIVAAPSVLHSWIYLGFRWAAGYVIITVGFAFIIEALGTNTGFRFTVRLHRCTQAFVLPRCPLVIPFAWAMTAYPVLLLSRRLTAALNPSVGSRFCRFARNWCFARRGTCSLTLRWCPAGYWRWNHNAVDLRRGSWYPSHELPRLVWRVSC